jgi:hypothetical protein
MSIEQSVKNYRPTVKLVPWGVMFVVIKVWGSALAAWSWWWVLLPAYPDLYLILGKLGLR